MLHFRVLCSQTELIYKFNLPKMIYFTYNLL